MSGTAASDLLCTARILLNDAKSTRYTDEALMKFLNMALNEIRAARPSEVVETVEVDAVAGDTQEVPDGFTFLEVEGAANADPETPGVTSTLDETMAKRFGKPACSGKGKSSGPYAPQSAKPSNMSTTMFTVSPPAPEGVSAKIKVSVIRNDVPDIAISECSPLGKQFDARIVDYILFRAFSIQAESAYDQQQAQFYCDKFYRALNVNYQAVGRVRSGFLFGADGTGNETVGSNRDLRGIVL